MAYEIQSESWLIIGVGLIYRVGCCVGEVEGLGLGLGLETACNCAFQNRRRKFRARKLAIDLKEYSVF